MKYEIRIAILIISTIITMFSAAVIVLGNKRQKLVYDLSVFAFKTLYGTGELILDQSKIIYPRVKPYLLKRKRKLEEIYYPHEADEINHTAEIAAVTYAVILLPEVLLAFSVTESRLVMCSGLTAILFLFFYFDIWLSDKIRKKHAEIRAGYPAVLTEISLMINSGITAYESFKKVAFLGNSSIYIEMQRVCENVENGMPMVNALDLFAEKCPLKEVRKFVSLYKQNIVKGSSDFGFSLKEMADSAWLERKNNARKSGEIAEQKLLIPTMMMFVGIIIMVSVPAFNSLF